jgi:hypothetical protein
MKTTTFSLLLVFAFQANLFAQTADEILDKHFAAIGGKEKLAQIHSMKTQSKMNWGNGMEIPATSYILQDKGFRSEMTVQGKTSISAVDANGKGWFISAFGTNKEAQPLPPDAVKQMQSAFDITGELYNYKEKGHTVEYVGKDDFEGSEVFKLKVTRKDGIVTYHYIDSETYYDLKVIQKMKTADKETRNETEFADFRQTNIGLIMPHSMGGQETTSIEFNVPIDESIFRMPGAKVEEAKPKKEEPKMINGKPEKKKK